MVGRQYLVEVTDQAKPLGNDRHETPSEGMCYLSDRHLVAMLVPVLRSIARSNRCVTQRTKRTRFENLLDPVHTNAFSLENAYISMRLGLLSTLKR